jgi:hypothetical protein
LPESTTARAFVDLSEPPHPVNAVKANNTITKIATATLGEIFFLAVICIKSCIKSSSGFFG